MGLVDYAQREKAGPGAERPKGPAPTPPEMLQQAQQMTTSAGPEVSAQLALMARNDPGGYAAQLESIKLQFGAATADILHADVQARLNSRPAAENPADGQTAMPEQKSPDELAQTMMDRMAQAVGVDPNKAQEEAEKAEEAGPDAATPDERAEEQQTEAESTADEMLSAMGNSPGVPKDKVPIKVDGEALAKTEAAGADGMVQNGAVYLSPAEYNPGTPAGQQLVAEETAHYVQQQQALTGGGSERSPMPAVEAEAQALAAAFVAGQPVPAPREVMGPNDVAYEGGAAGGVEAPTDFTFNLGGISITVAMPPEPGKQVTLQLNQSPLPGVTLKTAQLQFDDQWRVLSGTVSASIGIGSYVTMDSVSLTVSSSGAIQANVDGANLKVGDLISGTISLNLSAAGVTGSATVTHEQVTLPLGIVLQQGFMRVALDTSGSINAVGNLLFDLPGIGTVTLNASISNETIGGTATLLVESPITLANGVTLVEASLSGNYTRDGFTISGSSLVNVNDWAEAHITGSFDYPSMSWSANGQVTQKQSPFTLGGLNISNGQLSVVLDHGTLVEVGGGADFATSHFSGSVGGTYDVAKQSFTGEGRAELTQDLPLGSVATLKSANGKAVIEDNALKTVTASAEAEVNFQGQPTFTARVVDATYDVEASNLSGGGSVELTRDLSFAAGSLTATISAGASAQGTVTDNVLTEVTGGLDYKVTDQAGDLGGGRIDLTFNGDAVSGSGNFALSADYGFPDRAAGPAFLLAGSGLTMTVENNVPTSVTLDSVRFAVKNLGSDGSGELQGSAEGSVDLTTFALTGSASVSVSSPWTQTTAFGTFTVAEGTVTAAVSGGELDLLEAQALKIDAVVTAGQYTLNLEAKLSGSYSAKTNEASGSLEVTLVDDLVIAMGEAGELTVRGGETRGTATIAANQLTEVTFAMGVGYTHGSGLALDGTIPDGRVNVPAGEVSGTGTLSLAAPLTEETSFGEFSLLSGAVIATVEANSLTKVELQGVALTADLDVGDKRLSLAGSVSGEYAPETREVSGQLTVTLQEDIGFDVGDGELTVKGGATTGTLTLTANELTGATFGLEVEYAHSSGAKLIGRFENGSVDTDAGTVSGDGSLELAEGIDVPVPGTSWTLKLPPGAKAQVRVEANSVQQITSESLAFEIHNEAGLLVTGSLTNAVLDFDDLKFSGVAQAQVPAEQDLGFESAGYSFALTPCSVTATLVDSELTELSGSIGIKATKGDGSITASLNGTATKSGESWIIGGTGSATVEGTIEVGGAGGYTFLLQGGTGITVEMVANELTKVEGDLNALVKDAEGDFIGLQCKVTYQAADGGTIDANGACSLLGDRLLLEGGGYQFHLLANGTGANVVIVANELQEVGGSIGCKVVRTDNNLQIGGSAQGKWVRGEGAGSFTGSGDLKLLESILINGPGGFKFDFLAGSGGSASVENNELTKLGGTLKCDIHDQKGPLVHLECGGEYDAVNNKVVQASGQANMLRPIELMGGKIKVTNLTGTAEIQNNELVAAGGSANLEVEGFDKVEGSIQVNWSNRSGVDEYEGKATLKVQVNEKIGGSLEVELKKGGGFSVAGNVELKITDKIKGDVGFRMDETFDPALDGTITVEGVELLPGRELFGMEIPIVPNITIGPFYGINIVMGCGAGMKADMRPVTFGASIGVRDWHPKSPTDVPNFTAEASVSAGLDFIAGIKPYIGVSGGVAGAQAGIAVEGELRVTIPVELSPKLTLHGGPDGFGGEFAFGVSVTPALSIIVRPFLFAELAGKMARHDLTEWTFPLGTLFTWEWNKTYAFGDKGPSTSAGGADVSSADGGTTQQSFAQNESADMSEYKSSGGGGGGGNGKDSPQLEGSSEFESGNSGGGDGGGEMAEKLNSLSEKAEMLARIADLFTTLTDILTIASMTGAFAPVGVAAYIAYRVYIKGDLSLDSFVQAIKDLWSLITAGAEWLMANLPSWVKDVYDWVASGAKNIIMDLQGWFTDNLKELGQAALDFAADAGEWGKNVIMNAGKWAADAVGWAWDAISDAGQAIGDAWSSGVDYVSSWF
jgi:hypothetical protein